jgi:hypothetical protein
MTVAIETTISEKILLAAFDLEEAGQTPFSAEALIVSVWKKFPGTFGLKDFSDKYPDSNKVLVGLMGKRGLAWRGWLAKLGQKQYALTREGRQMVRRLLEGEQEEKPKERHESNIISLTREQEKFLQTLFASTAWSKFSEGQAKEASFADACRYWGITENLSGHDLDTRLRVFRTTLTGLDRLLGVNGEAILPGGRSVSGDEVGRLDQLHAYLEQRFGRHLALLRNRASRS